MCKWKGADGLPDVQTVSGGYEHGLFRKKDKFKDKCAIVASFRIGKGSATAMGASKPDVIGEACKAENNG